METLERADEADMGGSDADDGAGKPPRTRKQQAQIGLSIAGFIGVIVWSIFEAKIRTTD